MFFDGEFFYCDQNKCWRTKCPFSRSKCIIFGHCWCPYFQSTPDMIKEIRGRVENLDEWMKLWNQRLK